MAYQRIVQTYNLGTFYKGSAIYSFFVDRETLVRGGPPFHPKDGYLTGKDGRSLKFNSFRECIQFIKSNYKNVRRFFPKPNTNVICVDSIRLYLVDEK